jgi:hypothetical protein
LSASPSGRKKRNRKSGSFGLINHTYILAF